METVIILSVLVSLIWTAIVLTKDEDRLNAKARTELAKYKSL